MKHILEQYLKNLSKTAQRGDATEPSFYSDLEGLIKRIAEFKKIKNVDITTLPKRTEAGNPDFRVWDGKYHITGYIEAKDPSLTNLDDIEDSDQLKRYCSTFPNVILTNFYEFRLYRNNERIKQVMIGRPTIATKLKTTPPVENVDEFAELMDLFFSFTLLKVHSAEQLAVELANRTRYLRNQVTNIEKEEHGSKGHKYIVGLNEAFKKYLISTLTDAQFADLYAQTITYGLFAAKIRAKVDLERKAAFDHIPHTIGILRDVFRFISYEEPTNSLQIIVDDIVGLLNAVDIKKIFDDYYRAGKGRDPIYYFYETFLSIYDPSLREQRGVYYTPDSVVRYIIRAVHSVLKSNFKLDDGLANRTVNLLDPASGTLTFIAEAIRLASDEYRKKYGDGDMIQWIESHIIEHYFALEIMMAPYTIGHLKVGFIFEDLGYKLAKDKRFKLFLTNTLDFREIEDISIPGLSSLSDESRLAADIKKDQPILVIVGNPPYSGISANPSDTIISVEKGNSYVSGYKWNEERYCVERIIAKANKDKSLKQKTFIGDILMDYFFVDGKPLGERNPKWLQDDYVKFLRFAQWKIQESGYGIVAMITNHSYLDNPTFRGMRQSLLRTFDEIYVLDLHGNSLKKEVTPEGGKDENVFDIRQGVAITIFIKNKKPKSKRIYHFEIYGLRSDKYTWLNRNKFIRNHYSEIIPQTPDYFFIKRDIKTITQYYDWKKVNSIFSIKSNGLFTARDKLTIKFSANDVWNTVLNFSKLDPETARDAYGLGQDATDWQVVLAQKDILDSGPSKDNITPLLYRPFDIRYTYYTGKSGGFHCRPRLSIMRNMLNNNLALVIGRQGQAIGQQQLWNLAYIANNIIDLNLYYRGGAMLFPLYIYPNKSISDLFIDSQSDRETNISPDFIAQLAEIHGRESDHRSIVYYIYAILYSNIYREKYSEFLKIDFPRIPFTSNYNIFCKLCLHGKDISELHLMSSADLDNPIAKFHGKGDNVNIERIEYNESEKRLYINSDKYFENIVPEVWNYHIGGYQVLYKYLKDRKGRMIEDVPRYCKIVTAISKTIDIQKEIDKIYPEVEKNLIDFSAK